MIVVEQKREQAIQTWVLQSESELFSIVMSLSSGATRRLPFGNTVQA